MFESINNWLLKPYPRASTPKQKIFTSLVFGKVVFLFLYIFRPFQISSIEDNLLRYILGFALITFTIVLFNYLVITALFPKYFKTTTWNVGKMIFFSFGIVLMISVANWYYNNNVLAPATPLEKHSLLYFVFVTILLGMIPGVLFLYISERKKNKNHSNIANKISERKTLSTIRNEKKDTQNASITLFSDDKKESISININDLLYISSERNYATVFYKSNQIVKEKQLKTSLDNLEQQLRKHSFIVRCDRSYMVNTRQVIKMIGNARSYFLELPLVDFQVPVSKSFPKEFLYTLVN